MFSIRKALHMHCHTHRQEHFCNTFHLTETRPINHTSKSMQPSLEKHNIHSLQYPGSGQGLHWLLKTSACFSVGHVNDSIPSVSMTAWVYVKVLAQPASQISSQWYHGIYFLPSKVLMSWCFQDKSFVKIHSSMKML